jgi:hypothetical protein
VLEPALLATALAAAWMLDGENQKRPLQQYKALLQGTKQCQIRTGELFAFVRIRGLFFCSTDLEALWRFNTNRARSQAAQSNSNFDLRTVLTLKGDFFPILPCQYEHWYILMLLAP